MDIEIPNVVSDLPSGHIRSESLPLETWKRIREHDETYGLYPDIDDPEFAARLFRKTEFASLKSVLPPEDTCETDGLTFSTTPVQRLVARFLHPTTPYHGLLLNHGVGVGKTCSAITVAETYLETMPEHCVYILCPNAIADNFKRTIFDVNRLKPASKDDMRLKGERWISPQCTGMTYLHLTGTEGVEKVDDIQKEVDKVVRVRYIIKGYLAFANLIQSKFNEIPATVKNKEEREEKERKILRDMFNDHLLIIDECHNLRDSSMDTGLDEPSGDDVDDAQIADSAAGKKLTPIIERIVEVTDGMRLMLMTATPMYNTFSEIKFLMYLLLLNDTKDKLRAKNEVDVFLADGKWKSGGEKRFGALAKRYVSFMRGENPNTFPLRLTPPESVNPLKNFIERKYPAISLSRREGTTTDTFDWREKRIMKVLPLVLTEAGKGTAVETLLQSLLHRHAHPELAAAGTGTTSFLLDQAMQIGNITYTPEIYGTKGWEIHMKEEKTSIKGTNVSQFIWKGSMPIDSIFKGVDLVSHAPKIAKIVESIRNMIGISFVYSRYVKAGILPLAVALERSGGWCRVLADGTPAPLLKDNKGPYTNYYILLTSNDDLSPNFKGLINYATTFKNKEEARLGTKVKAILGSQVASEGLDLKCIRELHLLDGWYHLNRIEQIEGRGVRFCSHLLLEKAERNCLIYLHTLVLPKHGDETYETADLYAYRLATRKALPIGKVTRVLKEHAWDCNLNYDAILFEGMDPRKIIDAKERNAERYKEYAKDVDGKWVYTIEDKPYTRFCDYMDKCNYECKPPATGEPLDISTAREFDYRRLFLEKEEQLKKLFQKEDVSQHVKTILDLTYGDVQPPAMARIGLRHALDNLIIRRDDGIPGRLILQNDYIVFQPLKVTDTFIPITSRYSRSYGRLATQTVKSVLPAVVAAKIAEPLKKAKESLKMWITSLDAILAKIDGVVEPPFKEMNMEAFYGWRWLFHHFKDIADTRNIALKWWMDNVWTTEERRAVLHYWTQGEYDNVFTKDLARLFGKELFQGEGGLKGYLLYNSENNEVETYCYIEGESPEPERCTPFFKEFVEKAIQPTPDRSKDTGVIFGMLVNKKGNTVFKSVDKDSGKLDGAECSNTSNLVNHEYRIKLLHEQIKRSDSTSAKLVAALLLKDNDARVDNVERRDRQEALHKLYGAAIKKKSIKAVYADKSVDELIDHISHMSLKQSCPYMEFLLRWMDINKLDGKRWFFSVTDSFRAGVRMA